MMYPLVRELAADLIPVTVTCRVLKISPQGYYAAAGRGVAARDLDNAYLVISDASHSR